MTERKTMTEDQMRAIMRKAFSEAPKWGCKEIDGLTAVNPVIARLVDQAARSK